MKWVREVIGAYLAWCEPSSVREDPVQRRRVRHVALICLVTFLYTPLFLPYFLLSAPETLPLLVLNLAVVGATPLLMRREQQWAKAVPTVASTLLVFAVTTQSGYIWSQFTPWLAVIPGLSVLFVEQRLTFAIATGCGLGLVLLTALGAPLTPDGASVLLELISALCILSLVTTVTLSAEWTASRIQSDLTEAAQASEIAREEANLILDVAAPLVFVDANGVVGQCSKSARELVGETATGAKVWDLLAESSPSLSAWVELVWPTLSDPLGSFELKTGQLPTRYAVGNREVEVRLHAAEHAGVLRGVVMTLEDVSAEREAEAALRNQKELQRLTTQLVRDPEGMRDFLEESRQLVDDLKQDEVDRKTRLRWVHTLKGNAALVGLDSLSACCHELEEHLQSDAKFEMESLKPLLDAFQELDRSIRAMLGNEEPKKGIDLTESDHVALLDAIKTRAPHDALEVQVGSWVDEPVLRRFERLAAQAKSLAFKVGKGPIQVELKDGGCRAPPELGPLWPLLVHLVRNSIDHGLEQATDRIRARKPRRGSLRFEARRADDGSLELIFGDDGAGIDWSKLRQKAAKQGLPVEELGDEELLFSEGLSSMDRVTSTSGRGVGTSALLEVVQSLGGSIEVSSERGVGTTFELCFPTMASAKTRSEAAAPPTVG